MVRRFLHNTCILVLCLAAVSPVFTQSQTKEGYAIKNVNVIPMDQERIIPGQTVIVEDGVITKIGPNINPGRKVAIIDGGGKWLIPGFFDMHVHFFYEQGEHNNTCEAELKMMLANGMTTARILAGHPAYLDARRKVSVGVWPGPELIIASPQLVGKWPWPPDFKNYEIVDSKDKAEAAVHRFKREGYEAIKITFMVKAEVYDAIIESARKEGIRVTGHVGPLVKLPRALKTGQQIEHMDEFIEMLLPDTSYNHGQSVSDMNIWRKEAWATVPFLDEDKIPALVTAVKNSGIYVSPTNYFFVSTFGEPMTEEQIKKTVGYRYIPSVIKKERWQNWDHYNKNAPPEASRRRYVQLRKQMAYQLWRAGVPLMAGSDSPEFFVVQGFSLHDELEMFVRSGLTPFASLQTATINPAKYLGVDKQKGAIGPGKQALMLLLDKNPLEDIKNTNTINTVFMGKKWYDKATIEKMLAEAAQILGK